MMNAKVRNRATQGWTRRSSLGALLVAASAWVSAPAWAAAASDLTVTLVDTQPDPVSVSRTNLPANIVYRIRMENSGGNTVNQVVFTGSTDVGAYSNFVNIGTINPNCPAASSPVNLNVNSVTCQVGQLKAGESVEFFLLFQTPTSGTGITFKGHTDFSEGNSSNTKPAHFTEDLPPKFVGLITTDTPGVNKKIRTVLAPAGGKFFTGPTVGGVDGAVNSGNPWSTVVQVPSTSDVTNNQISLSTFSNPDDPNAPPVSFACSLANPGYFCYALRSTIDVLNAIDGTRLILPDGTTVLIVTLRQDASSLAVKKPLPNIGDIKIFYNPNTPTGPNDVGNEIPDCGSGLPTAFNPCVKLRDDSHLKAKKGYYEWTIWTKENGNMSW